jgi:hypothetical protein
MASKRDKQLRQIEILTGFTRQGGSKRLLERLADSVARLEAELTDADPKRPGRARRARSSGS